MSTATELKRPVGEIIWETVVGLANDERSISRRVLRDVTGLSYELIDDHIKRLETAGKVIKAGKGLIEVVPIYPPERPQSFTAMPSGIVKWEIGDICVELTPPEMRRHAMMANFGWHLEGTDRDGKFLRVDVSPEELSRVVGTGYVPAQGERTFNLPVPGFGPGPIKLTFAK